MAELSLKRYCTVNKKSDILAFLLILYIYIPFLWNIAEYSFSTPFLIEYILYAAIAVILSAFSINRKAMFFLLVFVFLLACNFIIVPYHYYVLVEGIQALVGISIPCLCVSNKYFDLNKFIQKWYHFAKYNFPLVILSIILFKKNFVSYSIFTGICVPNTFILSYLLLSGTGKRTWLYINTALNILVTAILGGRMAAVASLCMLLFAFTFSVKIKLWKKVILVFSLLSISFLIVSNFREILYWINAQLAQYGIRSRSISLLISQLTSNELYVTNRDIIYSACVNYMKERWGLPGGFGVPLYLTAGEYYYAHNIILQLFISFGVLGSIIILVGMIIRLYLIKKKTSKEYIHFLGFMLGSYVLIGMTGSSIWIHYLSTIFIALFFFCDHRQYCSKLK